MAYKSTKERRERILPLGKPNGPKDAAIGSDGLALPLVGIVYTMEDIAYVCGISERAFSQSYTGEVDCLRDVALYVAAKIFGREAENEKKERMRGRRKVIL